MRFNKTFNLQHVILYTYYIDSLWNSFGATESFAQVFSFNVLDDKLNEKHLHKNFINVRQRNTTFDRVKD